MGLLNDIASPWAISGALLLLFVVSRVHRWYRLSHIPGPWQAGWTRLWIRAHTVNGKQAQEYAALCQKYGPLVRIGPTQLVTDDPDLIRRMTNPKGSWSRSRWWGTTRFKPREENILSYTNVRVHDEVRKKMAPAYSGRENEMMEKTVDDQIAELVNLLETRYVTQNIRDEAGNVKYVDMASMSHWFTLDVITSLAYGQPLGDMPAEEDKFGYMEGSENSIYLVMSIGFYFVLWEFMEYTRMVDLMMYFSKGVGSILKSMRPSLQKRFNQGSKQPKDMLGAFIRSGMSYEQIESETTVQILAGSDTTATAIRSTLLQLMSSPAVYRRLTAEIDAAEQSSALSSPATLAETSKLPYLQACIKEGLRLWPPVCGWNPKETPPGGDEWNGIKLPGGIEVGWAALSLHHNAGIYGPNPELFVPERWIEASPSQLEIMNRTVDMVFYAGRFKCLGRNVALMELNKVFVELLRRYDLSLAFPAKPWTCRSASLWCQKNMWTQVAKREKGEVKIFSAEKSTFLEVE